MPNLLASTLWGGLYLFIIFALCCAAVIGFKIFQRRKDAPKAPPAAPPEEEPPQKEQKKPREVYYIVEKKKRKPQSNFSSPKKISFDD